jgi:hypothetical protein
MARTDPDLLMFSIWWGIELDLGRSIRCDLVHRSQIRDGRSEKQRRDGKENSRIRECLNDHETASRPVANRVGGCRFLLALSTAMTKVKNDD